MEKMMAPLRSSGSAASGLEGRARRGSRRVGVAAVLLVGLASALPGCQVWNSWLDMLKLPTGSAKSKSPAGHAGETAKGAVNSPTIIVYKISAPVGTFSGNDKVWQQLNEDALDSKTSVLMAQNGLRAGTGPLSRWPAIHNLIDIPAATTEKFVCETNGDSSLNVVTRAGIPDQIVVSIDRDLEQRGRAFEHCDDGFRLAMRSVRNKPDLVVQLEPVVTLGTVTVVRSNTSLGVTGTQAPAEEGFPDLRMAATLQPDQFLVLAPTSPNDNSFSVGSLWLSDPDKVPAMETVLVFVPAASGAPEAKSK
ncbi:MAG TPA: hypothetical protein VH253_20155 [Phycisphaerae bacterium]|nr:hypothetical protein [Phycisphaerae bacterium]